MELHKSISLLLCTLRPRKSWKLWWILSDRSRYLQKRLSNLNNGSKFVNYNWKSFKIRYLQFKIHFRSLFLVKLFIFSGLRYPENLSYVNIVKSETMTASWSDISRVPFVTLRVYSLKKTTTLCMLPWRLWHMSVRMCSYETSLFSEVSLSIIFTIQNFRRATRAGLL